MSFFSKGYLKLPWEKLLRPQDHRYTHQGYLVNTQFKQVTKLWLKVKTIRPWIASSWIGQHMLLGTADVASLWWKACLFALLSHPGVGKSMGSACWNALVGVSATKMAGVSCFMLCLDFCWCQTARVCHAKVTTKFTRMGFLLTTGVVGLSLETSAFGCILCVRLFLWFQPMGGQTAAWNTIIAGELSHEEI